VRWPCMQAAPPRAAIPLPVPPTQRGVGGGGPTPTPTPHSHDPALAPPHDPQPCIPLRRALCIPGCVAAGRVTKCARAARARRPAGRVGRPAGAKSGAARGGSSAPVPAAGPRSAHARPRSRRRRRDGGEPVAPGSAARPRGAVHVRATLGGAASSARGFQCMERGAVAPPRARQRQAGGGAAPGDWGSPGLRPPRWLEGPPGGPRWGAFARGLSCGLARCRGRRPQLLQGGGAAPAPAPAAPPLRARRARARPWLTSCRGRARWAGARGGRRRAAPAFAAGAARTAGPPARGRPSGSPIRLRREEGGRARRGPDAGWVERSGSRPRAAALLGRCPAAAAAPVPGPRLPHRTRALEIILEPQSISHAIDGGLDGSVNRPGGGGAA
jgi:hypothetical protein